MQFRGGLVRAVMRSAALFEQPAGSLLLVAPQPLAHRSHGGLKHQGGGLDDMLAGIRHQTQPMVISVLHLADQIEVAGWHSPPILRRRDELAPPSKLVISLLLRSLKHFSLTGGIRCTVPLPHRNTV